MYTCTHCKAVYKIENGFQLDICVWPGTFTTPFTSQGSDFKEADAWPVFMFCPSCAKVVWDLLLSNGLIANWPHKYDLDYREYFELAREKVNASDS